MEGILEKKVNVDFENSLVKEGITHTFKIIKYKDTQYFILCEYIPKEESSN
tara:strand:+ start:627 stop:779 length:153 start_codon:yes stop_codon:yes gene_type:complete